MRVYTDASTRKISGLGYIATNSKNKEISKAYNKKDKQKMMEKIEKEMMEAAKELDFERATELRDILFEMKME